MLAINATQSWPSMVSSRLTKVCFWIRIRRFSTSRTAKILRTLAERNTTDSSSLSSVVTQRTSTTDVLKPRPRNLVASKSPYIADVLTKYKNDKTTTLTSKSTRSEVAAATDLATCSLALAKCSASPSIRRSDLESDLMIVLFSDTEEALRKHSQRLDSGGVESARLLVSILHSLARLSRSAHASSPLYSLSSSAAGLLLAEGGGEKLEQLPPRSLSMAAWALSRLGYKNEGLFVRIAELALDGTVCSSWPRWTGSNLDSNQVNGVAKTSSSEKRKIAQSKQESGSPFEPMELSMLTTAIATTLRSSTRSGYLDRFSSFYDPSSSHLYSNQALVSLACSLSASDKVTSGEDKMGTRRKVALTSISEELSSRLDLAASSSSSPKTLNSSNQEVRYNLVGDEDEGVSFGSALSPMEISMSLRAFSKNSVEIHHSHQFVRATVNFLATTGLGSFPPEALTSTAFAVARAKFDEPPSRSFWDAVLSASMVHLRQKQLRASEISSLLWSLTTSSFGGTGAQDFARSALTLVKERPFFFSLPALAQTLWACSLQNVYDGDAFRAAFEHILSTSEMMSTDYARKKVAAMKSNSGYMNRPPPNPDSVLSFLLDEEPPIHLASGVTKIQSQLFIALLGLQLDAPNETHKVLSALPPAAVGAWRRALLRQTPKTSRFQSDVSRILSLSGVPHVQEHATASGLICDLLLTPPHQPLSDGSTSSPLQEEKMGSQTVIEVQGPTHFIRGEEVSNALAKDFSGALTLRADAALLRAKQRYTATTAASTSSAVEDPLSRILFGGLGSGSTAMEAARKLLQPTIKTQAKLRWLQSLGYTVKTVDFIEWNDAVSTEDKQELLEIKGIKK